MTSISISLLFWPPPLFHAQNLHVRNCFMIGPSPTLPCLQIGCLQSFKKCSGHRTHMLAAHPQLNDPSTYLQPEIAPSLAEPSFDFQPSLSQYQSSCPVGAFTGLENSEGTSSILSDISEVGSDMDMSMQKPELANMEISPPSPLIIEDDLPPPLVGNGPPTPSYSHDFPIPSTHSNSQSPIAIDSSQLSSSDSENFPHGPGSVEDDPASAAHGPGPCIKCMYRWQMNSMLVCT